MPLYGNAAVLRHTLQTPFARNDVSCHTHSMCVPAPHVARRPLQRALPSYLYADGRDWLAVNPMCSDESGRMASRI
eukprot:6676597-Heterocapsa_arctica.AAC.1